MVQQAPTVDLDAIAQEIVALWNTGRSVERFTVRYPGFTKTQAYAVAQRVGALRVARGESIVGRKIGFTNRTIWQRYDMHGPIWGYVYDATLHELSARQRFSISGATEPRIEPEIVFGLRSAPRAGMTALELAECCEWVAPGYEVVQSLFPNWKFEAPDTITAFGLHRALYVGPRQSMASDLEGWIDRLGRFTIELYCDGELRQTGGGANVLDSPLLCLGHLADLLDANPSMLPLQPGDVITTGTLTDALPMVAGQHWETRIEGIDLSGVRLVTD